MRRLLSPILPLAGFVLIAFLKAPLVADDPLVALSDEFNNPSTSTNWQLVSEVEGWNANQLQTWNIDNTRRGRMVLIPHASTWYQDWRGVLVFKNVTGDFVVTTHVEATNRAGTGAPASTFSLGGILVRTPRAITAPADWTAGGENYLFLSIGAAGDGGVHQFEVKTTTNSNSILQYESTGGISRCEIQIARIGPHFILLRRLEGGSWTVHRRYYRPDMPATLQIGLTTYTDWPTASSYQPFQHNQTVITGGNPDLLAAFEYVRYRTPLVPEAYAGREFSNPVSIADGELISFLASSANVPSSGLEIWRESTFPVPAADTARLHADYDNDGQPNLLEFFLGTNAILPNANPMQASVENGSLLFQFPRRRNFTGTSAGLQVTEDLGGAWSSDASGFMVIDDSPVLWQQVRASLPIPESGGIFSRLVIQAE